MQYDDFLQQVQEKANLATRDDADKLARAVLSTFGERLYRTRREKIASELPDEVGALLSERVDPERFPEDIDAFSLNEFYNRVGARTDLVSLDKIKQMSKAVMEIVTQSISGGTVAEVKEHLPSEFHVLLANGR